MSQNGQTHLKNLAAFAPRFLKVSDHFGILCIKGLNEPISNLGKIATKIRPKEKKGEKSLMVNSVVSSERVSKSYIFRYCLINIPFLFQFYSIFFVYSVLNFIPFSRKVKNKH